MNSATVWNSTSGSASGSSFPDSNGRQCSSRCPACTRVFVTAQVTGRGVGHHNHKGIGLAERFGSQHTHDSANMRPKTHEIVAITVKADGKLLKLAKLVRLAAKRKENVETKRSLLLFFQVCGRSGVAPA